MIEILPCLVNIKCHGCHGFLELSGFVAHELSAFSALFGKRAQ